VSVWTRYRLRLERKRLLLRAWRKSRELSRVVFRGDRRKPGDILLFATLWNERLRLPWFLDYYRRLGVSHFFIIDNGSNDGSREYLADQEDVSLWHARGSYRRSRFGMDWINALLYRHGAGHWVLVVDPDEFLVYPFMDTRPLPALTDWLDASAIKSFPAMLLDMYPRGPVSEARYAEGRDPFEILRWFDAGNYVISRNPHYANLWIQGGPRLRVLFEGAPDRAPALNKIPLVRWRKGYAYVSSTHMLLPRGLNYVYDEWGGEKPSGCLLHAKFIAPLAEKVEAEMTRRQHYGGSREYVAYRRVMAEKGGFWTEKSTEYRGWRQLENLGLISRGNWA